MNRDQLDLLDALEGEVNHLSELPILEIDNDTCLSCIYVGREKSIFAELSGHHLIRTRGNEVVRVAHPYVEKALTQHPAQPGDLIHIRARGTTEIDNRTFPKLEVIIGPRS